MSITKHNLCLFATKKNFSRLFYYLGIFSVNNNNLWAGTEWKSRKYSKRQWIRCPLRLQSCVALYIFVSTMLATFRELRSRCVMHTHIWIGKRPVNPPRRNNQIIHTLKEALDDLVCQIAACSVIDWIGIAHGFILRKIMALEPKPDIQRQT